VRAGRLVGRSGILRWIVPTNSYRPAVSGSLVAEAKLAVAAGNRAHALALLDGFRVAPPGVGRQLAPGLGEALVATARGKSGDEGDRQALIAIQQARSALRQIRDWLASLPFDSEDFAEIESAIAARRSQEGQTVGEEQERLASGSTLGRALGAGWLEWRWVSKPSGTRCGPYLYFRWREGKRKRTKYVGKVAS
jgi:hypothetical protein